MLRSIRWTLQLWHAAILMLALIGFGTATYYGSSRAKYAEVDAELAGRVHSLAAKLAGPLRRPPPPVRNPDNLDPPPNNPNRPRGDGPPGELRPQDRPPFDRPPEDRPQGERPLRELEVPPNLLEPFGDGHDDEPYLIIWRANGEIIKTTAPNLQVPRPGFQLEGPQPAILRHRGIIREAYVMGPQRTGVLIGRSTQRQRNEMNRLAWLLIATGGGVLAIGLAGGWILSLRVVRPIRAMTATAATISASQLSGRIDATGTASELGDLARVLNAMFDRLESSFEQQSRFTADASHELRTPLAVIHSHSELALSRDRTPDEYRRTIATCLRACGRMQGLMESLLLLARADAGQLKLDCQPIDLGQIADECLSMLRPLAAEKFVQVEADLPPTDITGDPVRLAQVVTNLLTNAIRYNCEGGTVRVAIATHEECVELIVSNTGTGIDAKDRPHVFDRFFRVDAHRNRESGGSGLGLAICKSIVEAHEGTIELTSDENAGTIFTVRLPSRKSIPEIVS